MSASEPSAVALGVAPRRRDLAGITVNRVWPTARRRLVGPFVFFDHMLRVTLAPGVGLDVPPHPHIGLATVTYLFEGVIVHRDSLGIEQAIRPRELNWMTAGRGIVHSERSSADQRAAESVLHGIQAWVALPRAAEQCAPSFVHHGAESLPCVRHDGVRLRIVAGRAFGAESPVQTASELFYVEAECEPGSVLRLPAELGERAAYVVAGDIAVGARSFPAQHLAVLADGETVELKAHARARVMLFGGAPLDGERHVWWNFVSSSRSRIDTAKADWQARRFAAVPGDEGYMPLPA